MYLRDELPERDTSTFTVDLHGVIAWLETQDPRETYPWYDPKRCIVCRFYQALGVKEPWMGPDSLYIEPFGSLANYFRVAENWPWTYGAALQRARQLLLQNEST